MTSSQQPHPPAEMPDTQGLGAQSKTVRLAIYFLPGEFEAAKAAYLGDFAHGSEPATTFTRWIGDSIERHCARSAQERAHAHPDRPVNAGPGISRTFKVPRATMDRIHLAIDADREVNRWLSVGAFSAQAVAVATGVTRDRLGGELPPAPDRLPARLHRPSEADS